MVKNTNLCVDLKTVMQKDALLVKGQCYKGLMTRDGEDHFLFEETCSRGTVHNPKLYDGEFLSMTRHSNGRYQCHLKTMKDGVDKDAYALNVYSELKNALNIIG